MKKEKSNLSRIIKLFSKNNKKKTQYKKKKNAIDATTSTEGKQDIVKRESQLDYHLKDIHTARVKTDKYNYGVFDIDSKGCFYNPSIEEARKLGYEVEFLYKSDTLTIFRTFKELKKGSGE